MFLGGKGEICPKSAKLKKIKVYNMSWIGFVQERESFQSPYSGRDFVQFGKTKSALNKRAKMLPSYSTHLWSFP